MPSAWVDFLLTSESYFLMYGGRERALITLRKALSPSERIEIASFLERAASGDVETCRTLTHHDNPVIEENLFMPEDCLGFYRMARDVFAREP